MTEERKELRAVLFDLDGTLVRTFIDFPAMRQEMQALSRRYGTAEVTEGEDDILEVVAKMSTALGDAPGAAARAEAFALLVARERAGCRNPERIEGASELLTQLREVRGIPVGIITRNCREVAEELLKRMELGHDVLIAREDVAEFKPHPAPVWRACALLDTSPANTAMVGDLWADVAAGRAAGVGLTIGIQWPHDPPQRFARCPPDVEVSSLEEVKCLLLPPDG